MHDAISQALEPRPECLVLDLSQLTFIDSSGIHTAIELAKRTRAENVRMVIVPGPRQVQRVFEICGLTDVLPFLQRS
jgi:anti-anti-sigma factor